MQIKVLDYQIILKYIKTTDESAELIKKVITDVSEFGKVGLLADGEPKGIGFNNIDVFVKFCEGAKLLPDKNLDDVWFSLKWVEVSDA